jgi:hypothetical protein
LAQYYLAVVGGQITDAEDDWVELTVDGLCGRSSWLTTLSRLSGRPASGRNSFTLT